MHARLANRYLLDSQVGEGMVKWPENHEGAIFTSPSFGEIIRKIRRRFLVLLKRPTN
jgi:hypothetical protein